LSKKQYPFAAIFWRKIVMKTFFCLLTIVILFAAVFSPAAAQIPRTLSYQGVLTDNAGKPRPDGSYSFTFRLYTSPTGGTAIWSESKSLSVKNGLFSTALGDKTPFSAAVKFDRQYWLSIQVGNEPELSPRMALTSVGYSFSSLRADTARVSVASLADTTWRHSGANIYRMNGNVGIRTGSPNFPLDVIGLTRITVNDPHGNPAGVLMQRGNDGLWVVGTGSDDLGGIGGFGIRNSSQEKTRFAITNSGNVGIGTSSPNFPLDIVGLTRITVNDPHGNPAGVLMQRGNDAAWVAGTGSDELGGIGGFGVRNSSQGKTRFAITNSGNVGIGTSSPNFPLDIVGLTRITVNDPHGNPAGVLMQRGNDAAWVVGTGSDELGGIGAFGIRNSSQGITRLTITNSGDVGIGTTSPTSKLHVEGTTTTKVLAITGGMDLAEPFEISESQPIPKGALVIIDEENPGQLKLSHQAYDKRVAGVVSGAGGINPGLTLTQEGVLEGGQNVALSGRVYALATAANGPIKLGDLLTTSEVPGHAMKATDRERWDGAIIGKAMSSLETGEGLVLVLVNLQ
jgi:hypothetical protein